MRVSKQFGVNSSKINREIEELNFYTTQKVMFSDVSSPSTVIYDNENVPSITIEQQKAVEMLCQLERAEEEKENIRTEIGKFSTNITKQSQEIVTEIKQLTLNGDRFSKGKIMYLYSSHYILENLAQSLIRLHDVFVSKLLHNETNSDRQLS